MKRTLSITACCLLAACNNHPAKLQHVQVLEYAKIDTAPLPNIRVIPSQRATELKNVDFGTIARQIRRNFADEPVDHSRVSLIMVDYAELPALDADSTFMKYPCAGPKYYKNYNAKPDRYYLNLKFYNCNSRPPNTPDRDITVTVSKGRIPPHEAIVAMSYEAIRDYTNHVENFSAKKLEVNLDY